MGDYQDQNANAEVEKKKEILKNFLLETHTKLKGEHSLEEQNSFLKSLRGMIKDERQRKIDELSKEAEGLKISLEKLNEPQE